MAEKPNIPSDGPERACPHCWRVNDLHDAANGATPKEGDVSLCWGCGGLGIFTTYGMRKATSDEERALREDPHVRAAQDAIAKSSSPADAVQRMGGGDRG